MTRRKAIVWILSIIVVVITGGVSLILIRKKRKLNNPIIYSGIISEISETIIPATETPGAKDANISKSIIDMIELCLSDHDRRTVLMGLDDTERYAQKVYSSSFGRCTNVEKNAIVNHFQNKGTFDSTFLNKVKNKLLGPSFFSLIKELTIRAYCTSQIGALHGLAYEHIPVSYIGCVPLVSNQRSWATA